MSSIECKSGVNHNIYRGLYPIREVKQYYRREFVNEKPLYICTFDRNNCSFKTWKYSQHIARHIHLKHIGIKELKCDEPNCAKTFKRPESLVQHQKNHLCGFGIDSAKMKDPSNQCGVKNIKKYYFRELDNDYYVFGCKWSGCEFVTNNSGSIRRHVHNQHLCPHSVANTNANNSTNSGDDYQNSGSQSDDNIADNCSGVEMPLIEIIELEGQAVIPQMDSFSDNPFEISANPVDIDSESDSSSAKMSSTDGLFSLKNYSNLYRKVEIEGEVYFQCNCKSQFITKSQMSLVRHIWTDIGRNDFECDINGCNARFDTELSLNKHKKNDHNCESNNSSSFDTPVDVLEIVSNAGLNSTDVSQTSSALTNGKSSKSSANNDRNSIQTSDEMSSLENLSQHFRQTLVDNQVVYDCKCGQFQTTSTASLLRHIALHKGFGSFECDLCNAQFDNEPSLYRHIEFDHNSNNYKKVSTLPSNSNFDSNYANNLNLNDKSNESIRDNTNSSNHSKDLKTSLGFEQNNCNSGLYLLSNYDKYFKKIKINGEVHYKCTFCSFSSRSEVLLIQHIWSHTGMDRFECDFDGCLKRFSTKTELLRHRKSHNTENIQTMTTPNSSYSAFDANLQIGTNNSIANTGTNGADIQQKALKSALTRSQVRKRLEQKSKRGLYSLKKYENLYTKVKEVDGFKFSCNCRQFQTRSQTSLVRHIWEHQSPEALNGAIDGEANQLENTGQSSHTFNGTANETMKRTDEQSFGEEMDEEYEECDEDLDEDLDEAEEECFDTSVANTSELRRSLTSVKTYKNSSNSETTNGTEGQNTSDTAGEELYMNSLIVKIEDRGFFCQWPECDFSDDLRQPVVEHIRQTHSNGNNSLVETSLQYEDNELDEICEESDETEEESGCGQQTATYSIEQFESLIGKEFRNNKLIYLCKATNCLFETALNSSIIAHIQQNHIIETSFYANPSLMSEFGESSEPNLNRFLCRHDYCNASFPSLDSLVEHKKIHSNHLTQNYDLFDDNIEEEMQQNYLNGVIPIKRFTTYSYSGRTSAENAEKFSKSIAQSSGKELFVCQFNSHCGYSSPVRGNIIRHIRRHTGDKPFICHIDGCNQRFAYSSDVKTHQHNDHNIN